MLLIPRERNISIIVTSLCPLTTFPPSKSFSVGDTWKMVPPGKAWFCVRKVKTEVEISSPSQVLIQILVR